MSVSMTYQYTKVADIKSDCEKKINLFSVVKYYRPPKVTKTGQWNAIYTLIDPSIGELKDAGVRLNLFAVEENMLPQVQIGDIVRFHRMKVSEFNGRPQLGATKGYSWLVFDPDDYENTDYASHDNNTLSDSDKERVKELHAWYNSVKHRYEEKKQGVMKLSEVQKDTYFDCVVCIMRVVDFKLEPHRLVTVCDATKVKYSSFRHKGVLKDDSSLDGLLDFCYDISVFDDHVPSADSFNVGDIIKISNVHCKSVPQTIMEPAERDLKLKQVSESEDWVEMVLHTGTAYGRGIALDTDMTRASAVEKDVLELQRELATRQQSIRSLQESLTVTDFPFQPFKSLIEVHKNPVIPMKSRIRIKVMGVKPKTVRKAIAGVCTNCNKILRIAEEVISQLKGRDTIQCFICKDEVLKLTYAFEMLFRDHTDFLLPVTFFDDDALKFFNKTKPSVLLEDKDLLANYEEKFRKLTNDENFEGNDNWVEMCVLSYRSPSGAVLYKAFGTSLI